MNDPLNKTKTKQKTMKMVMIQNLQDKSLSFFCFAKWSQIYAREVEVSSEPSQTAKMELFGKIVDSFQPSTIFVKNSILDIWLGSKCASEKLRVNIP